MILHMFRCERRIMPPSGRALRASVPLIEEPRAGLSQTLGLHFNVVLDTEKVSVRGNGIYKTPHGYLPREVPAGRLIVLVPPSRLACVIADRNVTLPTAGMRMSSTKFTVKAAGATRSSRKVSWGRKK